MFPGAYFEEKVVTTLSFLRENKMFLAPFAKKPCFCNVSRKRRCISQPVFLGTVNTSCFSYFRRNVCMNLVLIVHIPPLYDVPRGFGKAGRDPPIFGISAKDEFDAERYAGALGDAESG